MLSSYNDIIKPIRELLLWTNQERVLHTPLHNTVCGSISSLPDSCPHLLKNQRQKEVWPNLNLNDFFMKLLVSVFRKLSLNRLYILFQIINFLHWQVNFTYINHLGCLFCIIKLMTFLSWKSLVWTQNGYQTIEWK